jgi:hypothetical protein
VRKSKDLWGGSRAAGVKVDVGKKVVRGPFRTMALYQQVGKYFSMAIPAYSG